MQHYCNFAESMKYLVLFFLFTIAFSCKKVGDDLSPMDDNELITSVEILFENEQYNNEFTVKALDRDGDGVFEYIQPITLDRNSTYNLEISVFDDSKPKRVDVTEGIEEESDVHLFIYRVLPASIANFHSLNKDKNGLAFGRKAKITTKNNSSNKLQGAKLQVLLKHQPPVNGKPVKNGDEDLGSTDIDLSFDLMIK